MIIRDYKHLIGLKHIHMPYGANAFKVCESETLMVNYNKNKYKNDQLWYYVNENKTKHNKMGHLFEIIHTGY